MQTPDDEQFETYLKRFHPIAPEPIKTRGVAVASRRWFAPAAWVAALAAVLMAASIIWHARDSRVADRRALSEPLTMRTANAWLATAPSFEAAIDDLASHSRENPIPPGEHSALAVLSR